MKLLSSFAQFLISQWIWSFTYAIYHPLINILVTILLLIWSAKQRIVSAVFYAVCSQLWALIVFAVIVHLFLDKLFNVSFESQIPAMIHPLAACFLLGVMYAALQMLFFYILSFFWRLPLKRYAVIIFLSNTISALLIYRFLPTS